MFVLNFYIIDALPLKCRKKGEAEPSNFFPVFPLCSPTMSKGEGSPRKGPQHHVGHHYGITLQKAC